MAEYWNYLRMTAKVEGFIDNEEVKLGDKQSYDVDNVFVIGGKKFYGWWRFLKGDDSDGWKRLTANVDYNDGLLEDYWTNQFPREEPKIDTGEIGAHLLRENENHVPTWFPECDNELCIITAGEKLLVKMTNSSEGPNVNLTGDDLSNAALYGMMPINADSQEILGRDDEDFVQAFYNELTGDTWIFTVKAKKKGDATFLPNFHTVTEGGAYILSGSTETVDGAMVCTYVVLAKTGGVKMTVYTDGSPAATQEITGPGDYVLEIPPLQYIHLVRVLDANDQEVTAATVAYGENPPIPWFPGGVTTRGDTAETGYYVDEVPLSSLTFSATTNGEITVTGLSVSPYSNAYRIPMLPLTIKPTLVISNRKYKIFVKKINGELMVPVTDEDIWVGNEPGGENSKQTSGKTDSEKSYVEFTWDELIAAVKKGDIPIP